ncbi:uncharacterized protein LOC142616685 [Castanea sativa]|uniref:uncharacterized protein LOC142616685 n=1 Tax=Castanea sativa TaxID=21020 RepID=UPI003F64DCE5
MTSPDIQKEIANATAIETINATIKDIGDSLFAIIVEESRDMSTKEKLAITLRYVDKLGHVNERFLGITQVNNTTTVTLKSAIEEVFNKYSLSISRLWGQGYNGASNMQVSLSYVNPDNLFSAFNKEKLIRLAQFYPSDFSTVQLSFLDNQLETYIHDMRSIEEFSALNGIGELAEKMVEMKKDVSYLLVYSIMTLALILPVATATVEKAFQR